MTDEIAYLAERFRKFADPQVRSSSPLYARLTLGIAELPDVLALCVERLEGQPAPLLLFGAVHSLLLAGAQHPLRQYYPDLVATPHDDDPVPVFADFCLQYADELRAIIRSHRVQTNEVGRCSLLLPAFSLVALQTQKPLAIIEIGASAGLHLCWDSYGYEYSNGQALSPSPEALLTLQCEVRGAALPLMDNFPQVAWRVGLELHPLDVVNRPEDRAWLRALLWPENPIRVARYEAAVKTLIASPQRLIEGDAIADLPTLIAEAPEGCALCVVQSFVLYQFTPKQREAFQQVLVDASQQRDIYSINLDSKETDLEMRLTHYGQTINDVLLARIEAHGKWIEWM